MINFAAKKRNMRMEKVRTIKLFKTYYKDFYVSQAQKVRDKINFVLKMVETQQIIPKKFSNGQKSSRMNILKVRRQNNGYKEERSNYGVFEF